MAEGLQCPNTVANFREWQTRLQERRHGPLARYALDRCEEAYRRSEWATFGYWFEIYRRERASTPNFDTDYIRDPR
jgi:hypothetical protein